ncbi:MAG: DEAD/DEAH box helicase [Cyanobacteria bacterium P01_E01_bin.6]
MAILHGSWLVSAQNSGIQSKTTTQPTETSPSRLSNEMFFIWGEVWRRVDPIVPENQHILDHPYGMSRDEFSNVVRSLQTQQTLSWPTSADRWQTLAIALPTHKAKKGRGKKAQEAIFPEHSASALFPEEIADTSSTKKKSSKKPEPPALQRWSVSGMCLTPGEALQVLHSLPLNLANTEDSVFGGDLTFWAHIARWNLDLLARSKYLPLLDQLPNGTGHSSWRVLLDSAADQARLEHYATQMPMVCRAIQPLRDNEAADNREAPGDKEILGDSIDDMASDSAQQPPGGVESKTQVDADLSTATIDAAGDRPPFDHPLSDDSLLDDATSISPFPEAKSLVFSFLDHILNEQVRSVTPSIPLPTSPLTRELPLREWLQSLAANATVDADPDQLKRLQSLLTTWAAPIQRQLAQEIASFRTALKLIPPSVSTHSKVKATQSKKGTSENAKPDQEWTLEYGLQAIDDEDFWIGAEIIWDNPVDHLMHHDRLIEQPQETLLAGLGLAARLYSVIEPSLHDMQPVACSLHPLQVYEFIKTTAWQLQDSGLGVVLPPSLSNRSGWANRLGLAVRAETPRGKQKQGFGLQSLLNFKWELTIGGQRLSKEEFERLVAMNTPLVEINGEWVELRAQDIKAAHTFFESRKDQMSLSLEDALRISTGDSQTIEKLPVVDFEASGSLQNLLETLTTGNQNLEDLSTPEGFRGSLRPYQIRGMSWLNFLTQWGLGACLADDMGLGKTIQLIALLLHLKEHSTLEKPILLICPTSVLGNWEREVRRFAPELRVAIHHGSERSQGKTFEKLASSKDLILTSYALCYRDEKTLKPIDWQGIVLDEAQNIKNSDAKQSQVVRQFEADFRIALTGTPVENRLSELWSIIDFLNPGYLGPRNFFQRRFAVPIERYGDTDSLNALRSLVQPFILRRLKTDRTIIQDLPDKQEMNVFCGLSEAQADLYQKLVDQSLESIDSAEGIQRRGMILALLTRLKQLCNHPVLLSDESAKGTKGKSTRTKQKVKPATDASSKLSPHSSEFPALSGKLQRLEEMLDELLAEGDRALIFTQFAEWGKLMKTHLEKKFGREVLFLYGSTSREQREAMVDRFQNDPQGPRLFILSLKAGGVGLNLTRANHVFHFDRWWNPAVENQATDRAFRIGQTRNVQVHKFVCSGTLEERINELIESKKALSEQVVGTGENWLTDFDTDQLRNLLLLDRNAVID